MPARRGARPLSVFAGMLAMSLAVITVPATMARAADSSTVAVPKPIDLDGLFAKLKQAQDVEVAQRIQRAIEQRWARSGSDTADLLMQRADAAISAGDRPLAIEILDRIIVLDPDWAEAWNRRATVFFLEEDFARSAADIQHVLLLEPRQFGALMGLAGILERIGNERKALEAYQRVLDIYPLLPGAQKSADHLKSELGDTSL